MARKCFFLVLAAMLLAGVWTISAQENAAQNPVSLTIAQKDLLTLEPILVAVHAPGINLQPGLDNGQKAIPTSSQAQALVRFTIEPPVKPRPGAKPLELEGRLGGAQTHLFDLLEWFQFPAGTFTVKATVQKGGTLLSSAPIQFTIRRPDKKDAEWGPVDRLHHIPWSNYVVDAFCGDTFDVVKRWPDSRLAKYCHYWNGLHLLHKKDYQQALASFRTVVKNYPNFELAAFADLGIVECLFSLKQFAQAAAQLETIRERFHNQYAWANQGKLPALVRLYQDRAREELLAPSNK